MPVASSQSWNELALIAGVEEFRGDDISFVANAAHSLLGSVFVLRCADDENEFGPGYSPLHKGSKLVTRYD